MTAQKQRLKAEWLSAVPAPGAGEGCIRSMLASARHMNLWRVLVVRFPSMTGLVVPESLEEPLVLGRSITDPDLVQKSFAT